MTGSSGSVSARKATGTHAVYGHSSFKGAVQARHSPLQGRADSLVLVLIHESLQLGQVLGFAEGPDELDVVGGR